VLVENGRDKESQDMPCPMGHRYHGSSLIEQNKRTVDGGSGVFAIHIDAFYNL
jgi:hypothetical protein